ncbi:sodium channel protein Nach-like [Sipha flava]|uniref:Sodium channel protein Nach-like n=1 Tax=Sipha flava TaxID=143950 RepID=A0A8B8FCA2_9HEMI|nr:sodium channel protein Nach-like [Sipha flava]
MYLSDVINGSKVVIALDRLPNERLKRNVVRSRMDLIVSVGGTLGLFLGVSLLSIVEIFYYFIVWTKNIPHDINAANKKNIHRPIQNSEHTIIHSFYALLRF